MMTGNLEVLGKSVIMWYGFGEKTVDQAEFNTPFDNRLGFCSWSNSTWM